MKVLWGRNLLILVVDLEPVYMRDDQKVRATSRLTCVGKK